MFHQKNLLQIHFFDVGQGDAAIVECDGHYMLIDGVNKPVYDKIYGFNNVAIEEVKQDNTNVHAGNEINAYIENGNIVVVLGDLAANVKVSDMLGNIIYSQTASGNVIVDMSSHSKGIYLVNVVTRKNSYTQKVVLK